MPSVWNFVGVEARTAFTALVFQVSTASGGTAAGLWVFAEAADSDAVTATARTATKTSDRLVPRVVSFMSPPLRTRPPRRRGLDRARRVVQPALRRGPRERRRRRSRSRRRERRS